ncbi:MAG TPA: hypothetical protein VFZ47_03035 [Chitinophagaceae bacterium]
MDLPASNADYALNALNEILAFCRDNKWPVTEPIVTKDNSGTTRFIVCPFISSGIPVRKSHGDPVPIEKIDKNSGIMVCNLELDWKTVPVIRSQPSWGTEHLLYMILIQYNDTALAVAGDHIFMVPGKRLITADRLRKGDLLLSSSGQPVKIHAIHAGAYKAKFHHISTERPAEGETPYQFIDTNGLISGDYSMPYYLHDGKLDHLMVDGYKDLPEVGSHQYIKENKEDFLQIPVGNTGYVKVVEKMPGDDTPGQFFLPAVRSKIDLSPNAHFLVPIKEAKRKLEHNSFRRNSDRLSEIEAKKLIGKYQSGFSEIRFILDWNENDPNAVADIIDGQRIVVLYGGLARIRILHREGIALFLGHEVGHHRGAGIPCPDEILFSEGQSDFNGIGHMKTLFDLQSDPIITEGIAQAAQYFEVDNSAEIPNGRANCDYPANECRIATYHAAHRIQPIPECAL